MNHFDLAYCAAAPFFFANAKWKQWRHGKYRRSLPGMFGAGWPDPPLPPHVERAWLHSVSVGETIAAGALFRVLRQRQPGWEFLSTTTTETGQDQAHRSLAEAQYHAFAPADLGGNVRRFLHAYRPSLYLFFETEIWPNILLECGRRRIPVFLVNGKLSERSARGYRALRPLLARPLSSIHSFLMQTEGDADRIRSLVGEKASIHVTGNVKFDNLPRPLSDDERRQFRQELGADDSTLLFLVGSTHPTEEKIVYTAFRRYVEAGGPPARLAIAPRHPERFAEAATEIEKLGGRAHRLSTGPLPPDPATVTIVDRMGVLGRLFGASDIALVGGAWNPIGGHNLLEPAAHGVPVIHGPHMHAQKEIMRIMHRFHASREASAEALHVVLGELAASPEKRRELGERGRKAAQENTGAATRSVDIILGKLDSLRQNARETRACPP